MPCSTLDIYPTVLAATGAVAEKQIQPLDGVNLLPLFDGKMTERGKADALRGPAQPGRTQHAALLDWPYKLHTDASKSTRQERPQLPAKSTPVLLYDVSKDPKETTNLAAQQPDRVAKMTAELAAWKTSALKSLAGDDYGPPSDSKPAPANGTHKKAEKR